jgi:hypothetical protein
LEFFVLLPRKTKQNQIKFGGDVLQSRSFFSSVVRIGALTIGSSADSGFEEGRILLKLSLVATEDQGGAEEEIL